MRVGVWMAILLVGSLPGATAWGMRGSWEPDLLKDRNDGWMFASADTSRTDLNPPMRKVYFNGFFGQCSYPVCTAANPNVASLRTAHATVQRAAYAMLGVWKDCNRDGYAGLGDQGLIEYRIELLADTSVCKAATTPSTPPNGQPPFGWFPSHNDGQWVREFLPIGWTEWQEVASVSGDENAWDINDNGSRVWYDPGLPTDDLSNARGCWINPQPRGTYHNAGGLIEYGDCFTGYLATDTWNENAPDDTPLGQLTFSDRPRDQSNSASALNVKPWGEESDGSFVEPWDCSRDQVHVVVTPPDGLGLDPVNVTNVSTPRTPPAVGSSGSLAGTTNTTMSGFDECHRTAINNGAGHEGQSYSTLPYFNEADLFNAQAKTSVADLLTPVQGSRPNAPFANVLGRATPDDFGLRPTGAEGIWDGNVVNVNQYHWINRDGPRPTQYATYYAYVSPSAITQYGLTMPKVAAFGSYGSEICSGRSGIVKGWNCDATGWYVDQQGADIRPRTGRLSPAPGTDVGIRVGALYNLRDVDCFDESISGAREAGISWGTLSSTPPCR